MLNYACPGWYDWEGLTLAYTSSSLIYGQTEACVAMHCASLMLSEGPGEQTARSLWPKVLALMLDSARPPAILSVSRMQYSHKGSGPVKIPVFQQGLLRS